MLRVIIAVVNRQFTANASLGILGCFFVDDAFGFGEGAEGQLKPGATFGRLSS